MSAKEMERWAKIGRKFIKDNPRLAAIGRLLLDKVKREGFDVSKL